METCLLVPTVPASSVKHDRALLNGAALPDGLVTTAWFEWGFTTNYGNHTGMIDLGSGSLLRYQ